jgi:hypothetical protein
VTMFLQQPYRNYIKLLPAGLAVVLFSSGIRAQAPTVEDTNLAVRTVVSGLTTGILTSRLSGIIESSEM